MIIFDCEIKKMILGRNERVVEGLQYCEGWGDYAGMGVSVVCAFDTDNDEMHTLLPEDDPTDAEYLQKLFSSTDYIVGFNNHGFDNKLLAAINITIPKEKSYDIYEQVIDAAGLSNAPFAARKGYRLDDLARANHLSRKNDDEGGALAPMLYQRGEIERLHRYCQNDVQMTVQVLDYIMGAQLMCPVRGCQLPVKRPSELLGSTQSGLF
jgi:hypothetical protein